MENLLQSLILHVTQLIQVFVFVFGCYCFSVSYTAEKERKRRKISLLKRFAIVMAAHNEELVIGHMVDSLLNQNYPRSPHIFCGCGQLHRQDGFSRAQARSDCVQPA